MNILSRRLSVVCCMLGPIFGAAVAAPAQSPEPDAAALKAFTEMIETWRAMPALQVNNTVKVEIMQGDVVAYSDEVKAEFLFGRNRHAVVKLRGFTCYLSRDEDAEAGTYASVHEKTESSYFTTTDDGSPYYALLNSFMDLPFPEVAIMLGEDAIEDVLMQFHPKAWGIVPTAVAMEEHDGKQVQRLTLSSDFAVFDLRLDPETKLIESAELNISGGDLVQPGATITYKYAYEFKRHDQPPDPATFRLDPGQRQKVDLMAALMPKPEPRADAGGDGEIGHAPGNALIGQVAPPIKLQRADGKAFDLADMQGRVVVLDFWASWCGPCMMALPALHEVARWASDEQLPVTIMTVNCWEIRDPAGNSPDARRESALRTWERKGFTLPIAMDYDDQTAGVYRVRAIPTTVIIRSDGVVHKFHEGAADGEALKADIQGALKAVEPGM